MCWEKIEHFSLCDVRPKIATLPFTDDGTGDWVDPFHVESHNCSRKHYEPLPDNIERCPWHTCCVTCRIVHNCNTAPCGPATCAGVFVSHDYLNFPADVPPDFGRPSWSESFGTTYPIEFVYSQRSAAPGDGRLAQLRQVFFQLARQLYLVKRECAMARNEINRVITELRALHDQRSYEERDAAFTSFCLDKMVPLNTQASAAAAQLQAIPKLTQDLYRVKFDLENLVLGPGRQDQALLEMNRYDPWDQLRWVQDSFTGPLLEIKGAADFLREIVCRFEVHHQQLTGMRYEGPTGTCGKY